MFTRTQQRIFPQKRRLSHTQLIGTSSQWTDQCQPYNRYLLATHLFPSFTASGSGVMPPLCCPVKYHPIPVIARSGRITWTHVSTYNNNNDVIQSNKNGRLPGSDFCSFRNSVLQITVLSSGNISHFGERAPFQCVIKYTTNLLLIVNRVIRYLLHKRNLYDYGWFKSQEFMQTSVYKFRPVVF